MFLPIIFKGVSGFFDGKTEFDLEEYNLDNYMIVSQRTNEIVIEATYVAETFAGTETASWSRGWLTIPYLP